MQLTYTVWGEEGGLYRYVKAARWKWEEHHGSGSNFRRRSSSDLGASNSSMASQEHWQDGGPRDSSSRSRNHNVWQCWQQQQGLRRRAC